MQDDIFKKFPNREHSREWMGRNLLGIGFYPKYWKDNLQWARNIDPDKFVKKLAADGYQRLDWGIPEGPGFVDMEPDPMHPAVKALGYDYFERVCRACRRHGLKLLFCIVARAAQTRLHSNKDYYKVKDTSSSCPHDEEAIARHCAQIKATCERYDMDGIIFDGPFTHGYFPRNADGSVFCQRCAEKYRAETGRELPEKEDWNNPDWKAYMRWTRKFWVHLMKRLTGAVLETDPRLHTSYNQYLGTWMRNNDEETAKDVSVSYFYELHTDSDRLLQPGLAIKGMQAAVGADKFPTCYHKSWDLMKMFPYGEPSFCDCATLAYLSLANCGSVVIHSSMDQAGHPHKARTKIYADLAKDIHKRLDCFVNARPQAHVGIHFSANSRDFYGGVAPQTYGAAPAGAEEILLESHLTSRVLFDHQLTEENLKDLPVLFLANSACLSREQCDAVRQYVEKGGALIATGETSLYDENENFRGQFALSDVLGVDFAGIEPKTDMVNRAKGRTNWTFPQRYRRHVFHIHPHAITRGLPEYGFTPLAWYRVKARKGRAVLATWAELADDTNWTCVNTGLEIIGDSGSPVMVAGKFGQGRVVYIIPDVTGAFVYEAHRHIRQLVAQAVEWLAPAAVCLQAPRSVMMTVTRQGTGKAIVNLVNAVRAYWLADEHMGRGCPPPVMPDTTYLPQDKEIPVETYNPFDLKRTKARTDFPNKRMAEIALAFRRRTDRPISYEIDEVIPVHDLLLEVDARKYAVKKALLYPGKKDLKIKSSGKWVKISIPRVDIHAAVVLMLKDG